MDKFLSCDWGTSTFRLRLIDAPALNIIAEEKSDEGIAGSYQLWQQEGGDMLQREAFFTKVIKRHIDAMALRLQVNMDGVPVILSGMASSTIGMAELPYKELPFLIDGSDLEIRKLETAANPYLIISGACTADDVMRGEETKIIGCADQLNYSIGACLLVMPGTHAKHVYVQNGIVTGFSTYMTGEFFELLAKKSILSASVILNENAALTTGDITGFNDGVLAGKHGNLLHNSFMVRTNQVLKKMPPGQNYHYLSGLLMGTELASIQADMPILLLSGQAHQTLYSLALKALNFTTVYTLDADEALIKGQQLIFSRFF